MNARSPLILLTMLVMASLLSLPLMGADKGAPEGKKTLKKPGGSGYNPRPGSQEEDEEEEALDSPFGADKQEHQVTDTAPVFLTKDDISRVIKRNYQAVKFCYQKELNRNKTLQGSVKVTFYVELNGSTSKVSIDKDSTLKHKDVHSCIIDKFTKMQFPSRPRGEAQKVTFPFRFVGK